MLQTESCLRWVAVTCLALLGASCAAKEQQNPGAGTGGEMPDGGDDGGGVIIGDEDGGDDGGGIDTGEVGQPWQYDDGSGALSYKDPGYDDTIGTYFTGTVSNLGAPTLVYPLNNSLHPNNIGNIVFQWDTGANTAIRIDVQAGDLLYHFYVPCAAGGQCQYQMPASEWLDLGDAHAGEQVTITLNGVEQAGGPVHQSTPYVLNFSPEPVEGALYYWASTNGVLKRVTLGADKAVPFIWGPSGTNRFSCTACHSVSRDGNVIAFAVAAPGGENFSGIQIAPTEDPENPIVEPQKGSDGNAANNFGSNVALSPDGKLAAITGLNKGWVGTDDLYFEMRDATDGTEIMKYYMDDNAGIFGGGNLPLFPEFSPDGKHIAVQMSYHNDWDPPISCVWTNNSCASGISVLDVADDGTIAASRDIIKQEWYGNKVVHYYPTWSPDGKFIAFVSGIPNDSDLNGGTGEGSFQNRSGILRIVRSDAPSGTTCPGADCWDLSNGTGYAMGATDGFRSTWPKFTPFAQRKEHDLFFISFTTNRAYGYQTMDLAQIWMFAIDVSTLTAGVDPSYAPMWLPYQETTEQNLEPYWTEHLPCKVDPEGGCSGCADGEKCITSETDSSCFCAATVK